jgi:hypothetical protein
MWTYLKPIIPAQDFTVRFSDPEPPVAVCAETVEVALTETVRSVTISGADVAGASSDVCTKRPAQTGHFAPFSGLRKTANKFQWC